jgi:hypothetical protein
MKKLKLGGDLERDILEGDKNSSFRAMANKRRRKKQIHMLQDSDGEVYDTTCIIKLECII